MNAFITRIIILGKNDEKREVQLESGLNIITGDSKTGKSALLEIVDYCFFSSRSTIPKGVIEDFAEFYVITLKLVDKFLLIARPSAKSGKGGKAIVRANKNDNELDNIDLEYLSHFSPMHLKDAQEEVERHFGLSVLDTRVNYGDSKQKDGGKASLRSFVPFLFQHQNLIANKHSIFYRFEDFYKRKKTIQDFPILMGWETADYFRLRRELEDKKAEYKAHEKLANKLKINKNDLYDRLMSIINTYYSIIGLEISSDTDLNALKKIAQRLPDVSETAYADTNLKSCVNRKRTELEKPKEKLEEVQNLLDILDSNSSLVNKHVTQLKYLDVISHIEYSGDEPTCPICHQKAHELAREIVLLRESKQELKIELSKIGSYANDNSAQIEYLHKQRDDLKREIRKIEREVREFEKQDNANLNDKSHRDQAFNAKGFAEAKIEQLLGDDKEMPDTEDVELKERIQWLKEQLEGFDVKSIIRDAEAFLSTRMTEICKKLDFEEELRPGVLRFELEKFNFYYHFNEKEKILLSEMGSGANWLACHLSLFLALLHLNCRAERSTIPAILFIDQPSQVYFPTEYGKSDESAGSSKEENICQVLNIFNVINEELASIQSDCGFMPQIVVMEHADEQELRSYVKKKWSKDGDKLI